MAGVFTVYSGKILGILDNWADIPSTLVEWVYPFIFLGLTISIMWQGYGIMRGAGGNNHLLDVFFNSLKVLLIWSLALGVGAYSSNIEPLINDFQSALTSLFTGDSVGNVYHQLDTVLANTFSAYNKILTWGYENISVGMSGVDLTGLTGIIGGGVMVLVVVVYCLAAGINLMIIEFSLAFIIAVGPIFIACLAFSGTNSFFNTWLSAVIKYLLTAVVIAAVVSLGSNIVYDLANDLSSADPEIIDYVAMTFTSLATSAILVVLTTKAGSIGAELGGGAALQIAGIARAVKAAINPAGAVASGAGKLMGYGAGKAAGASARGIGNSSLGRGLSGNRAMQRSLNAINSVSSGTSRALNSRSMAQATKSGFQSHSGIGTINK